MNIEVRGIGFPNKGAELMLIALIQALNSRLGGVRVVLPPSTPYNERAKYGTWQLGLWHRFGVNWLSILYLMPKKIRQHLGLIMPSEIDIIIDASGFAYGDQWGAEKLRKRLADNIADFKRRRKNRKVILLPQALGPFTQPEMQLAMAKVIDTADIIFARDQESLDHVKAIQDANNVYLAPDFTNLFQAAYAGDFDKDKQQICFIPNAKMVQMKEHGAGNPYQDFMAAMLKSAVANDLKPFLLIHEGEKDRQLGHRIMQQAGVSVPVIHPDNAADVKAIIGLTRLVVSSRFHGLVSALSQGVPVLATGWSHKYKMLLSDYQMQHYLFDETTDTQKAIDAMLALSTDSDLYSQVCQIVSEHASQEKSRTQKMWDQVQGILSS
ncbi:polysaccharide pyruvyl transferase family protein [Lacimicrobium sp. SS2-24]|uniref:polysaccharide pyruvyl transferase family protein n=1 Tax=Lacimicrobium sp. SS2-24 TaxID=2005569 RepID=UPI000B4BFD12|nr:polysaccharide pyruvyl transferase family protein [Lacimicrobium sp. SS2-24]